MTRISSFAAAGLAVSLLNTPLALLPSRANAVITQLSNIASSDDFSQLPTAGDWGVPYGTEPDTYDVIAGVAVIKIHGVLVQRIGWLWPYADMIGATGYDRLRVQILAALSDPKVDAIVFDVNSPGGDVAGCFDLADTIYNARGIKPMAAILGENAYSAAYALISGVDPGSIYVPRTGGTGSVGVIYMHLSYEKMLKKDGIKPTLVTKGDLKGDCSPLFDLSASAFERLKADVLSVGNLFDATVARNRGLKQKDVFDTQAGTFPGELGVDVGFADAVMAPDEAFRAVVAKLD
jgi:ClpP class serine protease